MDKELSVSRLGQISRLEINWQLVLTLEESAPNIIVQGTAKDLSQMVMLYVNAQ